MKYEDLRDHTSDYALHDMPREGIRAAALTVTDMLGADCRDILEALGMLPYEGANTLHGRAGRAVPSIRPGSLT